jgi:hypothetical protein
MSTKSTSPLPVSCIIIGLFSVRNGSRLSTARATGSTVYHQQYLTAVSCTNGQRIQASLRAYSPPGDQTLTDETVIFLIAKAVFPKAQDAILEAIRMFPFPGDPLSDSYQVNYFSSHNHLSYTYVAQDQLPDFTVPVIIGLGHVSGSHRVLSDGHSSRAFPITVGDYIQNSIQTCTIECVFYDLSTLFLTCHPAVSMMVPQNDGPQPNHRQ